MAKVGTVHLGFAYTARNGCRVTKSFASQDTADRWLDRVGATDIRPLGDVVKTHGGWAYAFHAPKHPHIAEMLSSAGYDMSKIEGLTDA